MSSEAPSLPPSLGPYRIIRQLGQGGMGVVYEAVHDGISRRVAIKLLRSEYAHNSQVAQRFANEARAANLIEHPAMVQISEFGQLPDGSTYLVMELLKGENLASRLRRHGALPLPSVLHIGCQLAEALCAAHAKQVIHRDLKPENIMLVPDSAVAGGERIKLLDFGIAKLTEAGQNLTATSAFMGTPKYMSPEQARGAGSVDDKTDVYALGVILFELLAGRAPFEGVAGELIAQHLYTSPPPLAALVPSIPPVVAQSLGRLLEKDTLQRPNMATVHRELTELLRTFRGQDLAPVSASGGLFQDLFPAHDGSTLRTRVSQLAQRRWRGMLLLLGVAAILLGAGGWMRFGRTQQVAQIQPAEQSPAVSPAPDAKRTKDARGDGRPPRWSITTDPPGAQVLSATDQREVGQTPWSFQPPAGSRDQAFIVRLKGYQDQLLRFRGETAAEHVLTLDRKPEPKPEPKKEERAKGPARPATNPGPSSTPLFTPKPWMKKK